jgi:rubredoxin
MAMMVPKADRGHEPQEKGAVMSETTTRYESPCAKYVYDPEVGDLERGIQPGTPFEDLPDDWCCPKCGAEKEYFEKLDD